VTATIAGRPARDWIDALVLLCAVRVSAAAVIVATQGSLDATASLLIFHACAAAYGGAGWLAASVPRLARRWRRPIADSACLTVAAVALVHAGGHAPAGEIVTAADWMVLSLCSLAAVIVRR